MSQYLPFGNFHRVKNIDDNPNFFDFPEDSNAGYILEVDLQYSHSPIKNNFPDFRADSSQIPAGNPGRQGEFRADSSRIPDGFSPGSG